MPKKVAYDPVQLSLWDDAELDRCACHIRADLGLATAAGFEEVLSLVERHGGEPVPAAPLQTGETEGELLRVNPRLPLGTLSTVLLHELVHRLAHSERYAALNPVRTHLPRRVFLELLAQRVAA
jgi:hypothetical protein